VTKRREDLIFLLSRNNNGNRIKIDDVSEIDSHIFVKVKQGEKSLGVYSIKDIKLKFL
jgi:hypothetical protein